MNPFDLSAASAPRPLTKWLPQAGALLAAGAVALLACQLPRLHTVSWGKLIGSAVACVLEVLIASTVTVWGICRISSRTFTSDTRSLILRTSLATLWIAPLALLIRENSPWAIVAAAVLVANVVKSISFPQYSAQVGIQADVHTDVPANTESSTVLDRGRNPFSLLESTPSFRWQALASSAALCAETGIGAALAGYAFTAAVLVGSASAVWTWSHTRHAPPTTRYASSRSSSRALWTIALAIAISAAALLPYLPRSFGMRASGVSSPYNARQGFPQGDVTGQRSRDKTFDAFTGPTTEGDLGIILTPDRVTRTKLVAPPPAINNDLATSHRIANPLVIPFDGVYWFFKAPDLHPPRRSRQAHGSPELVNIHSTDRRPLSMEAHDNLGSLIDLNCCNKIQIAIRNADPYSETVSLELVLINSSLPGKPSQSLGRVVVKSTRNWNPHEEQPSTQETLNFAIPANPAIHRFDELKIIFRLDAFRADDGAKIAIDHLVLVPRGL